MTCGNIIKTPFIHSCIYVVFMWEANQCYSISFSFPFTLCCLFLCQFFQQCFFLGGLLHHFSLIHCFYLLFTSFLFVMITSIKTIKIKMIFQWAQWLWQIMQNKPKPKSNLAQNMILNKNTKYAIKYPNKFSFITWRIWNIK
jgi:hypothetical protein